MILFRVVGSGWVDGNSDNRANSAKFQLKLPTGAELGKIENVQWLVVPKWIRVKEENCIKYYSYFTDVWSKNPLKTEIILVIGPIYSKLCWFWFQCISVLWCSRFICSILLGMHSKRKKQVKSRNFPDRGLIQINIMS